MVKCRRRDGFDGMTVSLWTARPPPSRTSPTMTMRVCDRNISRAMAHEVIEGHKIARSRRNNAHLKRSLMHDRRGSVQAALACRDDRLLAKCNSLISLINRP